MKVALQNVEVKNPDLIKDEMSSCIFQNLAEIIAKHQPIEIANEQLFEVQKQEIIIEKPTRGHLGQDSIDTDHM